MSLIDEILEPKNMLSAMMHVYEQKGAAGIDGMNVEELRARFPSETGRIAQEIREKRYKPSPVRCYVQNNSYQNVQDKFTNSGNYFLF